MTSLDSEQDNYTDSFEKTQKLNGKVNQIGFIVPIPISLSVSERDVEQQKKSQQFNLLKETKRMYNNRTPNQLNRDLPSLKANRLFSPKLQQNFDATKDSKEKQTMKTIDYSLKLEPISTKEYKQTIPNEIKHRKRNRRSTLNPYHRSLQMTNEISPNNKTQQSKRLSNKYVDRSFKTQHNISPVKCDEQPVPHYQQMLANFYLLKDLERNNESQQANRKTLISLKDALTNLNSKKYVKSRYSRKRYYDLEGFKNSSLFNSPERNESRTILFVKTYILSHFQSLSIEISLLDQSLIILCNLIGRENETMKLILNQEKAQKLINESSNDWQIIGRRISIQANESGNKQIKILSINQLLTNMKDDLAGQQSLEKSESLKKIKSNQKQQLQLRQQQFIQRNYFSYVKRNRSLSNLNERDSIELKNGENQSTINQGQNFKSFQLQTQNMNTKSPRRRLIEKANGMSNKFAKRWDYLSPEMRDKVKAIKEDSDPNFGKQRLEEQNSPNDAFVRRLNHLFQRLSKPKQTLKPLQKKENLRKSELKVNEKRSLEIQNLETIPQRRILKEKQLKRTSVQIKKAQTSDKTSSLNRDLKRKQREKKSNSAVQFLQNKRQQSSFVQRKGSQMWKQIGFGFEQNHSLLKFKENQIQNFQEFRQGAQCQLKHSLTNIDEVMNDFSEEIVFVQKKIFSEEELVAENKDVEDSDTQINKIKIEDEDENEDEDGQQQKQQYNFERKEKFQTEQKETEQKQVEDKLTQKSLENFEVLSQEQFGTIEKMQPILENPTSAIIQSETNKLDDKQKELQKEDQQIHPQQINSVESQNESDQQIQKDNVKLIVKDNCPIKNQTQIIESNQKLLELFGVNEQNCIQPPLQFAQDKIKNLQDQTQNIEKSLADENNYPIKSLEDQKKQQNSFKEPQNLEENHPSMIQKGPEIQLLQKSSRKDQFLLKEPQKQDTSLKNEVRQGDLNLNIQKEKFNLENQRKQLPIIRKSSLLLISEPHSQNKEVFQPTKMDQLQNFQEINIEEQGQEQENIFQAKSSQEELVYQEHDLGRQIQETSLHHNQAFMQSQPNLAKQNKQRNQKESLSNLKGIALKEIQKVSHSTPCQPSKVKQPQFFSPLNKNSTKRQNSPTENQNSRSEGQDIKSNRSTIKRSNQQVFEKYETLESYLNIDSKFILIEQSEIDAFVANFFASFNSEVQLMLPYNQLQLTQICKNRSQQKKTIDLFNCNSMGWYDKQKRKYTLLGSVECVHLILQKYGQVQIQMIYTLTKTCIEQRLFLVKQIKIFQKIGYIYQKKMKIGRGDYQIKFIIKIPKQIISKNFKQPDGQVSFTSVVPFIPLGNKNDLTSEFQISFDLPSIQLGSQMFLSFQVKQFILKNSKKFYLGSDENEKEENKSKSMWKFLIFEAEKSILKENYLETYLATKVEEINASKSERELKLIVPGFVIKSTLKLREEEDFKQNLIHRSNIMCNLLPSSISNSDSIAGQETNIITLSEENPENGFVFCLCYCPEAKIEKVMAGSWIGFQDQTICDKFQSDKALKSLFNKEQTLG